MALKHASGGEMKESSVEWLGEIPSHWDCIPIHAVTLLTSTHDPRQESDKVFRYIDVSSICNEIHKISEYEQLAGWDAPTRARNVVLEGDTIFATVRPYLRNIAQIPTELHDSICSTGYCVLRPKRSKLNSRYLLYSCIGACFVASVVAHQRGVSYPAVSDRVVRRQVIPLPPLHEQRAIASYLDAETARIDNLIAKTERLNELLREKRTALISQAVTKGLDADAEMKDSGVEWLGEIPRHWDVAKVRAICECRGGFGFPIEYQGKSEGELPFYKVSDMNNVGNETTMRKANNYIDRTDLTALNAKTARKGATIFPKIGAAVHTNKKRLLGSEAIVDNNVMAICAKDSKFCGDEYLYRYFQTIHLSQLTQPGPVPTISSIELNSKAVPLPPLAEQRAIADHLDRETARIDALIAKNDRLMDLLREKRTALISAAVTGKISVPSAPLVVK